MERLTNSDKEIPTLVDNAKYWLQVYFKLKDYEDLEEQGKVGDTDEYSCQGCECLECDSHKEYYMQSQKAYSLDWIVSEAEQKLKEMEEK